MFETQQSNRHTGEGQYLVTSVLGYFNAALLSNTVL